MTDPIAAALDKFVPAFPSAEGDWQAILTAAATPAGLVPSAKIPARRSLDRSGFWRRVPARVALVAAVMALAAVVTAVAFGWPQRIVDFFSSPPAPAPVVHNFATFGLGAPPGMNPHVRAGKARAIPLPDGGTVYASPAANHGFCFTIGGAGGCVQTRFPIGLSVGWAGRFPCGEIPPMTLSGYVHAQPGSTLQLEFKDGSVTSLPPPVWVGPPVNAGFVEKTVAAGKRTKALLLRNPSGAIIAKETDLSQKPQRGIIPTNPCPVTLPDGTKASLPPGAEAAKARKIINFRATDGSHVYLWVMPLAGGGDCFTSSADDGCRTAQIEKQWPPFYGHLQGALQRVLLSGFAKPEVATVVLRYQNGTSERLTPIDGFILHEITPAHYRRGTRLVAYVALNRNGKTISTSHFQPQQSGIYPCKKPINKGHGAHICP